VQEIWLTRPKVGQITWTRPDRFVEARRIFFADELFTLAFTKETGRMLIIYDDSGRANPPPRPLNTDLQMISSGFTNLVQSRLRS